MSDDIDSTDLSFAPKRPFKDLFVQRPGFQRS